MLCTVLCLLCNTTTVIFGVGVDCEGMQGSPKINEWIIPLATALHHLLFTSRSLALASSPSSGFGSIFFCVSALLEFNQCVLVSRKDPESRKKAVAHISERLTSNGYWPQVSCPRTGCQKAVPPICTNKSLVSIVCPGLNTIQNPLLQVSPHFLFLISCHLGTLSSNLECQEIKR